MLLLKCLNMVSLNAVSRPENLFIYLDYTLFTLQRLLTLLFSAIVALSVVVVTALGSWFICNLHTLFPLP